MAPNALIGTQHGDPANSDHAQVTWLIMTVLTQPWPPDLHPWARTQ